MTDSENSFQASGGSPEPPMRRYTPPQQSVPNDLSGIDVQGEIHNTSLYGPIPSSDSTESFTAARRGDTDVMPAASTAAIKEQAGHENLTQQPVVQPGYSQQQSTQSSPAASYASAPTQGQAGYSQQQRVTVNSLESGYASQPASNASYGYAQQTTRPQPASSTPTPSAPRTTTPKKSSGGNGKSFLFGFLGALLACALAFGGMAFAGGFNSFNQGSSTATLGTQNQSVIDADADNQTLAEAVASKALPSVVAIYNYQNQSAAYGNGFGYGYGASNEGGDNLVATGMGSGVVISEEGYIITNYHVVENAGKLTVSVNGIEREATYVGGDSSSDVAVVKVEDTEGLVAADIGNSDDLKIGEWVMTVGAPLGLESSVATGIVSATNRSTIMDMNSNSGDMYSYFYGGSTPEYTYYPNMIQTDAVINPGNSGGALVDADGKLIGINAMISSYSGDYAGVGFAIPINYAMSLAQDIIAGKEPTHAMMGVSLSQVNSTVAQQYNLSTDTGAYISQISEGTGAANSDLQVGDIITKIDGKAVTSPTEVTLEIRSHKVGDTIPVTVNRNGEEMSIDVTLGSDEDYASSTETQQQQQGQEQGQDQGMGQDPRGNNGGYTQEEIEEILKMLGM